MRKFFCFLAAVFVVIILAGLASRSAHADVYYADESGDTVQVTDLPCPASIATIAPEGMRGGFRLAYAHLGTDTGPACAALVTHRLREGPQIFILFESKAQWIINFNAFSSDPPTKSS